MFEKGKRERRQSEEDKVFNRMLFWLAGAVAVELLLLLLQKVYVDMYWGGVPAKALATFFRVFCVAGAILAVGGIVWMLLNHRAGRSLVLPAAVTGAVAGLWVVSALCSYLWEEGVRILLMLPAAAAVLIVIFFLYQRLFFYSAALTGGALLAQWLYGRYYMYHPRMMIACFAAGLAVLAVFAVLTWLLQKNDGKLGGARVLPAASNYLMAWITCGVVALAMILPLAAGVIVTRYLLYALAAWLFAQAVFFTVKMV